MAEVTRNLNTLTFESLDDPFVVRRFLQAIHEGQNAGFCDFVLDFMNTESSPVYPYPLVAIAGLIEYFRTHGFDIRISVPIGGYLLETHLDDPLWISENKNTLSNYPLNKIWKFKDSEEVSYFVECLVRELAQQQIVADGILDALSWSLYETMDNVLQHSKSGVGYVMSQVHHSSKVITLCIYDTGQGIFNSLRDTVHAPRNPLDAITLAIKEGVTRDKAIGQGNGLWGLHKIVHVNDGKLRIISHSAGYQYFKRKVTTSKGDYFPSLENASTTIEFQLVYSNDVPLVEVFNASKRAPSPRVLNAELEVGGFEFRIRESASGTGTRQAGQRSRNELLNLLATVNSRIIINFDGVSVISSSFADEFIGKLAVDLGLSKFISTFGFSGMNEMVETVVNRSMSQRLSQNLLEEMRPRNYVKTKRTPRHQLWSHKQVHK